LAARGTRAARLGAALGRADGFAENDLDAQANITAFRQ
jgi:hypothetical protein